MIKALIFSVAYDLVGITCCFIVSFQTRAERGSMLISGATLDDVLSKSLSKLMASGRAVTPSRGDNRELFGVLLHIRHPRARLSRSEKYQSSKVRM